MPVAYGAEVTEYRPDICLRLFEKIARTFSADPASPVIHEIVVSPSLVNENLPNKLTAYLQRPAVTTKEKLENLARRREVLDRFKDQIREHGKNLGEVPDEEVIRSLVPENQAHTFAIAVSEKDGKGFVSFSPTSPSSIDDQLSKHAMVTHDTDNTHAAGLLWRSGKDEKTGREKLCFNTDSGTFMKAKKRAKAGLETPPPAEAVLKVLMTAFSAATVVYCGEPDITRPETIPPGFMEAERLDAAEKAAEKAAKAAAKAVEKPPAGIYLDLKGKTQTKQFRQAVYLLTPEQLAKLPEGTVLLGLNDKPFVVGKSSLDEVDAEIRRFRKILPGKVPSGFVPVGYPGKIGEKAIKKANKPLNTDDIH